MSRIDYESPVEVPVRHFRPCWRCPIQCKQCKLCGLLKELLIIEKERVASGDTLHDWLDGVEVQELLHISPRTLTKLRTSGEMDYTLVGRKCFYHKRDIQRLMEERYTRNACCEDSDYYEGCEGAL